MTKQQKREVQLQKQIRKLERDYFVLQRENDSLKHEIKVLTAQNRTLDEDLHTAARSLQETQGKLDGALEVNKKIIDEVTRFATTNPFAYLKGK